MSKIYEGKKFESIEDFEEVYGDVEVIVTGGEKGSLYYKGEMPNGDMLHVTYTNIDDGLYYGFDVEYEPLRDIFGNWLQVTEKDTDKPILVLED